MKVKKWVPENIIKHVKNKYYECFLYVNRIGKNCLYVTPSKGHRAICHYSGNIDQLENKIDQFILRSIERDQEKKNQRENNKRQSELFKQNLSIGTILVSSWGYDQTNVDFYQVIGYKGKANVLLKKLNKKSGGEIAFMSHYVMPIKDSFVSDEILNKKINSNYVKIHSSSIAMLWDKKACYETYYA